MPVDVIMIAGQLGSGKNTVAKFLAEKIEGSDLGLSTVEIAFADPIRQVAKIIFGLTDEEMSDRELKEKKLERWPFDSPRTILRDIGTMLFRERWPGVWIKNIERRISETDDKTVVLVTDLRFEDEEAFAHQSDAFVLKVERPGATNDGHASEAYIEKIDADRVIVNDGTLDELKQKVFAL